MRRLDEKVAVAGQVWPEQMPGIAAAGFRAIVNNRPDGEEPGQPTAQQVSAAAEAAGLTYHDIPVAGGFAPEQVDAMAAALAEADGPLLAFCRSGTRSTFLWALAEASRGTNPEELIAKAEAAGYDLTPIEAYLTR
jgi:uncharacterized protein (TIGR01244 family)